MVGPHWRYTRLAEQFRSQAGCHNFARIVQCFSPIRSDRCHLQLLKLTSTQMSVQSMNGRAEMNRARYRVVQDFLHVVMVGVVTGVLFSMALTGVVFLISGQPHV
jgi:hypothetical protein